MTPPEDPHDGDETDWGALGTTWRSNPGPDLAALLHEVQVRRRRMIAAVVTELALTSVATVSAVRRLLHPTPLFTPGMAIAAVISIWIFQALLLYLRRRHWRTPTLQPRDLLDSITRRVRTAIVIVWVNAAAMAGTYLALSPIVLRLWRAGMPRGRLMILLAVHAGIVTAATWFAWWYLRRQHGHLRRVRELRVELDRDAAGST
jgi:hypothetical protein